MEQQTGSRGCMMNSFLFLVIVFLPLIGQFIETLMVLEDTHDTSMKVIWLVVIWVIPFFGPFAYLLFGQKYPKRGRVMFGQASMSPPMQSR